MSYNREPWKAILFGCAFLLGTGNVSFAQSAGWQSGTAHPGHASDKGTREESR